MVDGPRSAEASQGSYDLSVDIVVARRDVAGRTSGSFWAI